MELKCKLESREEEFRETELNLKARNRNLQCQLDALFDNGGQLPDEMRLDEEGNEDEDEEITALKDKIVHLEDQLETTRTQKQELEERIARDEREVMELAASLIIDH